MPPCPPFHFPDPPFTPLRAALSRVERVGRAVVRRARRGERVVRRGDGGRLVEAVEGARGEMEGGGGAVVYLPALAWGERFQRPQQLARALAQEGCPVLYVEGFDRTRLGPARRLRPVAAGVWRLELKVAGRPDPYRRAMAREAAAALAAEIAAGVIEGPRLVLAQLPFWGALGEMLARRWGVPLVYDRIDLHTAFPGVPAAMGEVEAELLARADLVTATAEDLAARSRPLARRVVRLPNAVRIEDFPPPGEPPAEPPRAAFVGALNGRLDAEALAAAAAALPGWEFHLAGAVEEPSLVELARHANVTLHGEIPHRRVPAFLAAAHAGLIPYRDLPLTRAIDPVKLYEMWAAGLPVVARRLPELAAREGPGLHLYSRPEELPALLERARAADGPEARRARHRLAAAHTWRHRARRLLAATA